MYEAAIVARSPEEAKLWLASCRPLRDTTFLTLANSIRAFCEFSDQYRLVRSDPSLVKAVRGEPALGFAVAHGWTHRDARCRDRWLRDPGWRTLY
jgi:hypothetical protein